MGPFHQERRRRAPNRRVVVWKHNVLRVVRSGPLHVDMPVKSSDGRGLDTTYPQASLLRRALQPLPIEDHCVRRVIQVDVQGVLELLHHGERGFVEQEESGYRDATVPEDPSDFAKVEVRLALYQVREYGGGDQQAHGPVSGRKFDLLPPASRVQSGIANILVLEDEIRISRGQIVTAPADHALVKIDTQVPPGWLALLHELTSDAPASAAEVENEVIGRAGNRCKDARNRWIVERTFFEIAHQLSKFERRYRQGFVG